MPGADATPVILLPGMGADNQVFSRQMEEIPGVVIPGWIAPREIESLPAYAARQAVAVNRMFRAMEMIQENRNMKPDEKRKAIDMLSLNIMYATGEANKVFRAVQQQQPKRGNP